MNCLRCGKVAVAGDGQMITIYCGQDREIVSWTLDQWFEHRRIEAPEWCPRMAKV